MTASILAATRTPVPAAARLEGIDLLPVLKGRAPDIERTLFWRVIGNRPQRAVRSGDWKLLFDGRPLLFHVRTDLGEQKNLIGQRSDIARKLEPLLAAWRQDVDDERSAQRPDSALPLEDIEASTRREVEKYGDHSPVVADFTAKAA